MPVGKPDEYRHNNPDRAYVDSTFVRGGARQVADRAELYALAAKADQLQAHVTVVRVRADALYDGARTALLLVDLANAGNASGWALEATGAAAPAGGGRRVSQAFDLADHYDLVHNLGYPPAAEVYDSDNERRQVPTQILDANTLRFYLDPATAGKIIYFTSLPTP